VRWPRAPGVATVRQSSARWRRSQTPRPGEVRQQAALADALLAIAERHPEHYDEAHSQTFEIEVERERARFGTWYELFPRSWGGFAGVRSS